MVVCKGRRSEKKNLLASPARQTGPVMEDVSDLGHILIVPRLTAVKVLNGQHRVIVRLASALNVQDIYDVRFFFTLEFLLDNRLGIRMLYIVRKDDEPPAPFHIFPNILEAIVIYGRIELIFIGKRSCLAKAEP